MIKLVIGIIIYLILVVAGLFLMSQKIFGTSKILNTLVAIAVVAFIISGPFVLLHCYLNISNAPQVPEPIEIAEGVRYMNNKWIEQNYYETTGSENINKVKSYYLKTIENQPWFRPIIRTFVESFNLEPMSRYCVKDVLEYLNQAVTYEFLRDYYD